MLMPKGNAMIYNDNFDYCLILSFQIGTAVNTSRISLPAQVRLIRAGNLARHGSLMTRSEIGKSLGGKARLSYCFNYEQTAPWPKTNVLQSMSGEHMWYKRFPRRKSGKREIMTLPALDSG